MESTFKQQTQTQKNTIKELERRIRQLKTIQGSKSVGTVNSHSDKKTTNQSTEPDIQIKNKKTDSKKKERSSVRCKRINPVKT